MSSPVDNISSLDNNYGSVVKKAEIANLLNTSVSSSNGLDVQGNSYEISKEHRKHGKLLKTYASKKLAEKLMNEVKDADFKLLYMNEKTALKVKKLIKRMRKAIVSFTNFEEVKITDLVES